MGPQLKWSGWLRLPRQLIRPTTTETKVGAGKIPTVGEVYSKIGGDKITTSGNNALRMLELAQPLRRCPERFVAPQSTLEALMHASLAETDFPILQRIFDRIVTNGSLSPAELGQAGEILKAMGLSMTKAAGKTYYEIRSEGDRATAERSASETRKLSVINLLRDPTSEISLRVSDFAAERFEKTTRSMPEEESKKLMKHIILLQKGLEAEESIAQINKILAPYNFKLKSIGAGAYELTSRATLTILSGPSGVGKGTAIQPLLNDGLLKLTFFTGRAPRGPTFDKPKGESHGIDYYFVQERQYLDLLLRPDFFVARAGVHGKYQGVHRQVFDVILDGYNLYAEMDIQLAGQTLRRYEAGGIDIRSIFLVPPEYGVHLERLIGRYIAQSHFSGEAPDISDIEKRAKNGVGEILKSITLPPSAIYIVNEVVEQTSADLRLATELPPPIDILSPSPNEAGRISGMVSIRKYREKTDQRGLQPVNSDLLVLNAQPEVMDRFRSSIVYRLTAPSRTTQDTVVRIASEALQEIRAAVWRSRGLSLADGKPISPDPLPTLGIQPGTLSPFHYGHMTSSYAGLLAANLNGVILLPGGETMDKPFALAAKHREMLVALALDKNPWILNSPLRREMAEYFRDISDATLEGGGTERKLALDLIAINWLIAMNPHVNWGYFLVGADKVNDYGQAKGQFTVDGTEYQLKGKSERQLLEGTLAPNNIGILYFEPGNQKNIVEKVEPPDSWLTALIEKARQQNRELFTRNRLPSFNIRAKDLRKMLQEFDPRVKDALDEGIIDYIYMPMASEEYTDASGNKRAIVISILQAFVLESAAIELGKRIKAGAIKPEEIEKEVADINIPKKLLAQRGILADERPLTAEELKNLV